MKQIVMVSRETYMNTYIALLRGINVGGNNKVPMADLQSFFVKQGFAEVKTYINSGNVIFKGSDVDDQALESRLCENFGFQIKLVVLKKDDFLRIGKKSAC